MPLTATLAGERVEGPSLDEQEWAQLKARYAAGEELVMACGVTAFPRRSPLGLQHFVHKVGGCALHAGGEESLEHLELKSLVANAARTAGWNASLEYAAPDRSWIADVMAEKDRRRIALEIQLSPQSPEEFQRRQQRYERAGIECLWYVAPHNAAATQGVPAHVLTGSSGSWTTVGPTGFAGQAHLDLAEAVGHHLNGTYQPLIEVAVRAYSLNITMAKCWGEQCAKWMTLWRLEDLQVETRCGHTGTLESQYLPVNRLFPDDRVERVIAPKVLPLLRRRDLDLPQPAGFKTSFSKDAEKSYLAYTCPTCRFMQGDTFIFSEWRWEQYVVPNVSPHYVEIPVHPSALRMLHACLDTGRGRCSQEPVTWRGPAFPDGPDVKSRPIPALLTDFLEDIRHRKTTGRRSYRDAFANPVVSAFDAVSSRHH